MKIYLHGGDNLNWALDDDLKNFSDAISDSAFTIVNGESEADVIYSVNWRDLLHLENSLLESKFIVACVPHDIRVMLQELDYLEIAPYINLWTSMSLANLEKMKLLGFNCALIRQAISQEFKCLNLEEKKKIKAFYNIPQNSFVIGSFQRDTEGVDLVSPKLVKGPDVFFQIIKAVNKRIPNLHILLAGPRRFWLRKQLDAEQINYTFVGENRDLESDDIDTNNLSASEINRLYNITDLYIVGSRLEGGPKAILECLSVGTPIISSRVGHAPDYLSETSLFTDPHEAIDLVMSICNSGSLESTSTTNDTFLNNLKSDVKNLYLLIQENNLEKGTAKSIYRKIVKNSIRRSFWNRIFRKDLTVCVPYEFRSGPWGGGNQFLKALVSSLSGRNNVTTKINRHTNVALVNSFTYNQKDIKQIEKLSIPVVHRIDGPTFLIRGKDKEVDDKMFEFNQKNATVTIFQTFWSFVENLKLGYRPVNPIIINNASDNKLFFKKIKSENSKKIRIVSTSWSENYKKGFHDFKRLSSLIDRNKYEYTFVGRLPEDIAGIEVISPKPSDQLNNILNDCDLYVAASVNDPCSNALVEALTVNLPVLYRKSGGHSELVSYGGISYSDEAKIYERLEVLSRHKDMYQSLITAPNSELVFNRYAKVLTLAAKGRKKV